MSLRNALPASVAALVLAACAAFSSADSPDDDGPAKDGEGGGASDDGSAAGTSESGAAPDDDSAAPTSDGGTSFGNDAAGVVRCGEALPDCATAAAGRPFTLCCGPSTGNPLCIQRDLAYCSEPVTIRCDGPEDCGNQPRCRNKPTLAEDRIEFSCWDSTDVALSACHDDRDCAGTDLTCRKLTCGSVVLGVCANEATVWPDASPCSLD